MMQVLTAGFSVVDPHRMRGTHSLLSEGLLYWSYVHGMYRSISLQPAVSNGKQSTETVLATELSLRVETTGKGGVPMRVVFPNEVLSGIERGNLPVETELEIKVPGYGGRMFRVRVFPGEENGVQNGTKSVGVKMSGIDHPPLRIRPHKPLRQVHHKRRWRATRSRRRPPPPASGVETLIGGHRL